MKKAVSRVIVAGIWLLATAALASPGQQRAGVLEPEDANEARLNGLQSPEQTMDAIGIVPGMTVAEIGTGRGRWVVQLAVRVGRQGRVIAEDIDREALDHLSARCARWGLAQVEVIVGDVNDPRLPVGQLDRLFVISSYHHFEDPVALLGKARTALKPTGKLAIGEWFPSKTAGTSGTPPERLKAQMAAAEYVLERIETHLEANGMNVYIFAPGAPPPAGH